jgi:hypothetical protein
MVTKETITLITSILGITFGAVGLAVSLLNYFRDRANLRVLLQWDMEAMPNPKYDPKDKWGLITVTNIGRRPIFIKMVAVKMPKGTTPPFLLILDSASGHKLSEGDPPFVQVVSQDSLKKHANHWKEMRAITYDSTGKEYRSKSVEKQPSWASSEGPDA